jgi:hypothetical protein
MIWIINICAKKIDLVEHQELCFFEKSRLRNNICKRDIYNLGIIVIPDLEPPLEFNSIQ